MTNDGTKTYDHQHDGSGQIQGSCIRDFRNKPFPVRLKIEYIKQGLTVRRKTLPVAIIGELFVFRKIYLNNGISQDDNAFEFCTRVDGVQLPKTGYLGVTAETGGLADDHDVLEFLTTTFSDKQVAAQNQAATDEQAKKYKDEYEKYEADLKKQQAECVRWLQPISTSFVCLDIRRIILIRRHRSVNKHWWVISFRRRDLQPVAVF